MAFNTIPEYSTTPGTNTDISGISIAEGWPAANINNSLRSFLSQTKSEIAVLGSAASAATVDITANGAFTISGTTTITAFTVVSGSRRILHFQGILTLTHNASSLILPTGANITTAAGDCLALVAIGTNQVRVVSYMRADGTALVAPTFTQVLPTGFLYGLGLTNNVSDANNDIDIATGKARDDGDTADMVLAAGLTKRLDANWAVGTNQGGLDTGSKNSSTWYHIWLIKRPDTGVVDALFSTSATAPTMPADYTLKRRLGSVLTDGSSNIIGFVQNGDFFQWKAARVDANTSTLGSTVTAFTMSTPPGFKLLGLFHYDMAGQSSRTVYFQSPNITDASASTSAAPYGQTPKDSATQGPNGQLIIETNTSSQIKMSSSAASTTIVVLTDGWWDTRGRG